MSLADLRKLYRSGVAISRWSPSIDRGTSDALAIVGDEDVIGNARVIGDAIDIGAYECAMPEARGVMLFVH